MDIGSIGSIGGSAGLPPAALVPVPASGAMVGAAIRPMRRSGRQSSAQDIIDDVPYTIIEQTVDRPTAATPRRRSRRTRQSAATYAAWRPAGSVQGATGQWLSALRAYTPYQDYLGVFVDVWA